MSKLELLFCEHFARTEKQLSDIKADNAEFKAQIKEELSDFKSEMIARFESLQFQINVLQNEVTGLQHDVSNLQHWNYWILAIIIAVFVLPHFTSGIKAFFSVIRDGVAGVMALFRKAKH